jgi:hypothetical protein
MQPAAARSWRPNNEKRWKPTVLRKNLINCRIGRTLDWDLISETLRDLSKSKILRPELGHLPSFTDLITRGGALSIRLSTNGFLIESGIFARDVADGLYTARNSIEPNRMTIRPMGLS